MMMNKYEAGGILVSIAVLGLILAFFRFDGATKIMSLVDGQDQTAGSVIVDEEATLEEKLADAGTYDGRLTRLVVEDVKVGGGERVAEEGDQVTVHYIGATQSGVQFDNSYERGEAYTFTLGEGKVIAGWEEGLLGMKVGGQRVLVVPPELAYGDRQVGPIEPNSILVYTVELLEVK